MGSGSWARAMDVGVGKIKNDNKNNSNHFSKLQQTRHKFVGKNKPTKQSDSLATENISLFFRFIKLLSENWMLLVSQESPTVYPIFGDVISDNCLVWSSMFSLCLAVYMSSENC